MICPLCWGEWRSYGWDRSPFSNQKVFSMKVVYIVSFTTWGGISYDMENYHEEQFPTLEEAVAFVRRQAVECRIEKETTTSRIFAADSVTTEIVFEGYPNQETGE